MQPKISNSERAARQDRYASQMKYIVKALKDFTMDHDERRFMALQTKPISISAYHFIVSHTTEEMANTIIAATPVQTQLVFGTTDIGVWDMKRLKHWDNRSRDIGCYISVSTRRLSNRSEALFSRKVSERNDRTFEIAVYVVAASFPSISKLFITL
jgi:hypothetical protein